MGYEELAHPSHRNKCRTDPLIQSEVLHGVNHVSEVLTPARVSGDIFQHDLIRFPEIEQCFYTSDEGLTVPPFHLSDSPVEEPLRSFEDGESKAPATEVDRYKPRESGNSASHGVPLRTC